MGDVKKEFHRWYLQRGRCWKSSTWRGEPIWKSAADLLLYQQVIWETRPTVIVETGAGMGGSALFFADMLRVANERSRGVSTVISVDKVFRNRKLFTDNQVATYQVAGSSVLPEVVSEVQEIIDGQLSLDRRVMVVLDSSHATEHVRRELESYAGMVSDRCYLVVEDTNHHVFRPDDDGDDPKRAVDDFLRSPAGESFGVVPEMDDRYGMSFACGGWLRKKERNG